MSFIPAIVDRSLQTCGTVLIERDLLKELNRRGFTVGPTFLHYWGRQRKLIKRFRGEDAEHTAAGQPPQIGWSLEDAIRCAKGEHCETPLAKAALTRWRQGKEARDAAAIAWLRKTLKKVSMEPNAVVAKGRAEGFSHYRIYRVVDRAGVKSRKLGVATVWHLTNTKPPKTNRERATEFLANITRRAPAKAIDLLTAAKAEGLSRQVLDEAASALGIKKKCIPPGPWYWCALGQVPQPDTESRERRKEQATAACDRAAAWLRRYLQKHGHASTKQVIAAGKEEGHSRGRLFKVKEVAGVGSAGTWPNVVWYLPTTQADAMPAAEKRSEAAISPKIHLPPVQYPGSPDNPLYVRVVKDAPGEDIVQRVRDAIAVHGKDAKTDVVIGAVQGKRQKVLEVLRQLKDSGEYDGP